MQPVIHHCELCVKDIHRTLKLLKKYGFKPFAEKTTEFCKQVAIKQSSIVFVVTEKYSCLKSDPNYAESVPHENLLVFCSRCEDDSCIEEHVDTVFNVALNVKNVKTATERIKSHDINSVIKSPTVAEDEYGRVEFSMIKSTCGNVIHTLINKDNYTGFFLPGFAAISDGDIEDSSDINAVISHIDHVTLACHTGYSESIIKWYKSAFGMEKFSISRDDQEDGLILQEGIGLRLRAMEYWMCSETGLVYPPSLSESNERSIRSLMLVVVESLPGQRNCNISSFLQNHQSAGVEHVAFSTTNMVNTVSTMMEQGVRFRMPPKSYYSELKHHKIAVNINMNDIQRLGILLDREEPDESKGETKSKFLMQIFAEPFSQQKTFFFEMIQRFGATGLGTGNVIALLRSIREDERRKAADENRALRLIEESGTHTRIC